MIKWHLAIDDLPTSANADYDGKVFWCGMEYVRLVDVTEILSWDFTNLGQGSWVSQGHWAETGLPKKLQYPSPPLPAQEGNHDKIQEN